VRSNIPRPPFLVVVPLLLGLAFVGGCGRKQASTPEAPKLEFAKELKDALATGLDSLALTDPNGADTTWRDVLAFYHERHDKPAWSNGRNPSRQAEQLVETVRNAGDLGLDPSDYDADKLVQLMALAKRDDRVGKIMRPRSLARLDVHATYAWFRFARHVRAGHVPWEKLDPDWVHGPAKGSWGAQLEYALDRDSAGTFVALEPTHDGYRALRDALDRYREIEKSGGWGVIPPGEPLQTGSRGPRVAALIRRLAKGGELKDAVTDTVYDRRIERAVGDLQTRCGVPRSGVCGEATRAILNVPVSRRIRQIDLNLERWRWLPDNLGARHLEVNIPGFRLELVRDGLRERAMRVVVGRKRSPTPVFSDHVAYLDLNPTWTMPKSVVVKEIVPTLQKDHDYLEKNHMIVIDISSPARDTVPSRDVPWKDAKFDSLFHYLVIQQAGPDNPLGRIKLMCPNEYDVYLHDTPMREKFGVATRDYSHGCVRVEEAVELADSLLSWVNGDSTRVDTMLTASLDLKRVRLKKGVPVHFMYWTTYVDSLGRVAYRDDLYGLDQRMDAALRAHSWSDFELNPGVELSPFWIEDQKKKQARASRLSALKAATTKQ
jgi:murein L,D-transpeptidase YcbB/YkuD